MTISGNAVISAIMLAIFSAMLIMAAGYSPEARFMPMIVGFAGAGLSLAQLWRSLASDRRTARAPQREESAPDWRREVRLLGWFAGFLLAIVAFGFLIAAPVMVLGFLVIDQRLSSLNFVRASRMASSFERHSISNSKRPSFTRYFFVSDRSLLILPCLLR